MAKKKEKIEHNNSHLITIYQVNFLAHSYIYYKLNDNILSDSEYDGICTRLVELMKDDSKLAKESRYYKICKDLDKSASGFFIKEYPQEIIDIANKLLTQRGDKNE